MPRPPHPLLCVALATALAVPGCRAPVPADTSPPAGHVAAPPPPTVPAAPPDWVPRERGGLELRAWRPRVHLYTNLELPAERLAEIADTTYARTSRWLGVDPEGADPFGLFLCGSSDELRQLERDLPLPGARGWRRHANGGYFYQRRAVALVVDPLRNTEWVVSHESWHVVFRDVARAHPVVLNEGLAEVLPSWILFAGTEYPEDNSATYEEYEAVLARLVTEGRVPSLADFFSLQPDSFHIDRWDNFSLAWSLARLLIESDDPEIRGRLPELVHRLDRSPTPWEDFCAVYDEDRVEALWTIELARFAGGTDRR